MPGAVRRAAFWELIFHARLAEREFFLFDAPGGAMGIGFFWGRWGLFFARQREKIFWGVFWVFFGVFVVFGGCFCAFLVFFFVFRAAREFFFWLFSPAVTFFSRGAVSKT